MNYYDILGIPHNASQEEIKKAYREQIKFFHPDVFDGPPEVARIKSAQLNEAYETLKDQGKRRAYDFKLWSEKQAREKEDQQEQHGENQEKKGQESKKESGDSTREKDDPSYDKNEPQQETDSVHNKNHKNFWQKSAPVAWALCIVLLITSLYFGLKFHSLNQQISSSHTIQVDSEDANAINEPKVVRNPNIKNYVASKEGMKYHYLSCRYAKNISEENSVYFADYHDALDAGYEPCSVCHPPDT